MSRVIRNDGGVGLTNTTIVVAKASKFVPLHSTVLQRTINLSHSQLLVAKDRKSMQHDC
jgi:hypothetical protein